MAPLAVSPRNYCLSPGSVHPQTRALLTAIKQRRFRQLRSRSTSEAMAPSAVQLPSDFGYVLGAAAFTGAVYLWQSFRVGAARRKYGVKYPKMYATGDDQDSNTFNCIQRSHQNSSETIGPVMVMQALLGLYHPITAASLGVAWAIGRIMYTIGYSSGDPAKRIPGFFVSFLCMVGLLCCGVIVGVQSVMQS